MLSLRIGSTLPNLVGGARDRITVMGFTLGWTAVRRLPAAGAYRLFDTLAEGVYRRNGKGVRRLRENYRRVRPELTGPDLERLVATGMRSYLRYWCEAFRLPDRPLSDIVAQVRVIGDEPVRADLEAGRGVVCFMAHLGNWDPAGAWSTTQLSPVTTVAERLRPEELFRAFLGFRERLGMTILPLTGAGEVFTALQAAVHAGALVPLLADRDLTATGIEVDLCGHRARVAPGPAALAVATGARLFPVSVYYEPVPRTEHGSGQRLIIHFHHPVEPPAVGSDREKTAAMTQACADALGVTIRERTEDWHMMQRVFVADLQER